MNDTFTGLTIITRPPPRDPTFKDEADHSDWIERHGEDCPECGSERISGRLSSIHTGQALQECECKDCGCLWTATFVLTYCTITRPGWKIAPPAPRDTPSRYEAPPGSPLARLLAAADVIIVMPPRL